MSYLAGSPGHRLGYNDPLDGQETDNTVAQQRIALLAPDFA